MAPLRPSAQHDAPQPTAFLVAALVAAAIGLGLSAPGVSAEQSDGHRVDVIVRHEAGAGGVVREAITDAGGRVERHLGLIDSFSAAVPEQALSRLEAASGVTSVVPDGAVELQTTTGTASLETWAPTADAGSMYNVTRATGARAFWAAGHTGRGVDVAVIDSGTVAVDGLRVSGKVVQGPDLSFDSPDPDLAHLDSFGHGTHMAGIIAGRDDAARPGTYVGDSSRFLGMAPDARLVNVKVADTQGKVDVSQVIAAIDWVVEHRRANGLNIRVLNLSFGTDSTQLYLFDPLAFAAEMAWHKGIVVVASAGNAGRVTGRIAPGLTNPAKDPFVIAVGAADSRGTVTRADDLVAGFSSSGTAGTFSRNPDLVAPGRSIVGVKSPGSMLDLTYPGATVAGRYMRGSGSSQAAAVTSGAAALILSKYPSATPDQVKALLRSTATPLAGVPVDWQGSGELDLARALFTPLPDARRAAQWYLPRSWGAGSLERSRGTSHLSFLDVELNGERDIWFRAFDSRAWASRSAVEGSWVGQNWNGHRWLTAWNGVLVSTSSVADTPWLPVLNGNRWSGNRWSGNRWSGNGWLGNRWSGNRWSGDTWS